MSNLFEFTVAPIVEINRTNKDNNRETLKLNPETLLTQQKFFFESQQKFVSECKHNHGDTIVFHFHNCDEYTLSEYMNLVVECNDYYRTIRVIYWKSNSEQRTYFSLSLDDFDIETGTCGDQGPESSFYEQMGPTRYKKLIKTNRVLYISGELLLSSETWSLLLDLCKDGIIMFDQVPEICAENALRINEVYYKETPAETSAKTHYTAEDKKVAFISIVGFSQLGIFSELGEPLEGTMLNTVWKTVAYWLFMLSNFAKIVEIKEDNGTDNYNVRYVSNTPTLFFETTLKGYWRLVHYFSSLNSVTICGVPDSYAELSMFIKELEKLQSPTLTVICCKNANGLLIDLLKFVTFDTLEKLRFVSIAGWELESTENELSALFTKSYNRSLQLLSFGFKKHMAGIQDQMSCKEIKNVKLGIQESLRANLNDFNYGQIKNLNIDIAVMTKRGFVIKPEIAIKLFQRYNFNLDEFKDNLHFDRFQNEAGSLSNNNWGLSSTQNVEKTKTKKIKY